ncbi:MAG TPA: Do family serine endopeptidase [Acidobacteriaceae bacterium]|nr:Do family serine endopeptidase [Acidobacteriaceae bacterium]
MNFGTWKKLLCRRIVAPALAAAALAGAGTWELARPVAADAAAAAAAPAPAPPPPTESSNLLALDQSMEALAERVTPAVVNVTVVSQPGPTQIGEDGGGQNQSQIQQFFGPGSPFGPLFSQPMQQEPEVEKVLGSGVIISPDGYIATNNHVVRGAVNIRVTLSDRDVYPAKLIGADPLTDLAVIKIDAHNLPALQWGNSAQLKPGQMVLAFGNPYGFSFSVTRGIVSALNRPNPTANRYKPGEFIQTDAAINEGNSGGALVDARGQVIGINTFLISPSGAFAGMGFAIPSEIAQPTVNTIIRDGKAEHGIIGVTISDVTPSNAKFFDMTKAEGAVVTSVSPDSPASKAGLKTGDVITALDGKPVTNSGELQMEVVLRHPGETVHLQVSRNGKTLTVPVTLEAMNGSSGSPEGQEASGKQRWGLGLTDLTPAVRQQIGAPDSVQGAVVRTVQPGSPADDAGLQPGDVIVSVDRKPTQTASGVARQLSSIPPGQDALVLVWSGGGDTFLVLHPSQG